MDSEPRQKKAGRQVALCAMAPKALIRNDLDVFEVTSRKNLFNKFIWQKLKEYI
jgi:hypothetical protein